MLKRKKEIFSMIEDFINHRKNIIIYIGRYLHSKEAEKLSKLLNGKCQS